MAGARSATGTSRHANRSITVPRKNVSRLNPRSPRSQSEVQYVIFKVQELDFRQSYGTPQRAHVRSSVTSCSAVDPMCGTPYAATNHKNAHMASRVNVYSSVT